MVKITRRESKAYISFQNFSNCLNPWTKAYPLFKENGEVTEGVKKFKGWKHATTPFDILTHQNDEAIEALQEENEQDQMLLSPNALRLKSV